MSGLQSGDDLEGFLRIGVRRRARLLIDRDEKAGRACARLTHDGGDRFAAGQAADPLRCVGCRGGGHQAAIDRIGRQGDHKRLGLLHVRERGACGRGEFGVGEVRTDVGQAPHGRQRTGHGVDAAGCLTGATGRSLAHPERDRALGQRVVRQWNVVDGHTGQPSPEVLYLMH
ncbi:hypothetical protein GCM10027599_25180 [Yimella radicis]